MYGNHDQNVCIVRQAQANTRRHIAIIGGCATSNSSIEHKAIRHSCRENTRCLYVPTDAHLDDFNTSRLGQYVRHFANDIFKLIFLCQDFRQCYLLHEDPYVAIACITGGVTLDEMQHIVNRVCIYCIVLLRLYPFAHVFSLWSSYFQDWI